MVAKVKEVREGVEEVDVEIPEPRGEKQDEFVRCIAKRQMAKCGRRGAKTFGFGIKALLAFTGTCNACLGEGCLECDNTGKVKAKRVLYAAPTAEQVGAFWHEVCNALDAGAKVGVYKKNETEKYFEVPGSYIRIKAKTAWNANTLRGDFADLLGLDEYQLMNEDAWQEVGQPMLLDNDGAAVFMFTPPSLKSEGVSKAKDPRHASKLFKKAAADTSGRWKTFHWTSFDNPTLSKLALKELTESGDMSDDSYRREILAQDDEVETSWLVYSKFSAEKCKIKRFEIPKEWPVLSGHDFGTANPAALLVAQVKLPLPPEAPRQLRYNDYVAFREYIPGGGYSTQQHVERFKAFTKGYTVVESLGGNVTTEEEIRQGYRKEGWNLQAPALNRVNAQIDKVMMVMEQDQFYVFEDLYGLLGQIANCMWEIDTDNKPTNKIKDEAKYHLLACLRYMATVFNMRKNEEEMPVWRY